MRMSELTVILRGWQVWNAEDPQDEVLVMIVRYATVCSANMPVALRVVNPCIPCIQPPFRCSSLLSPVVSLSAWPVSV